MHVLLTGMSGAGKSTLVRELRRRGLTALDADDDGYSVPRDAGRWGWDAVRVAALLREHEGRTLLLAGCSEEQADLPFDLRVLLTLPEDELLRRLSTRTTNSYGSSAQERAQVLADVQEVEPLLRRSADLVLDATEPVERLADAVVRAVS